MLGLVQVGVAIAEGRPRAVRRPRSPRPAGAASKKARIEGVLVCEMVRGGVEMVVGVVARRAVRAGRDGRPRRHLRRGARDVTFRVPPFDADEAGACCDELKGYQLLEGVRGAKPADVDALVDVIMNVQRLALDLAGRDRASSISTRWSCGPAARSPSTHWW